MKEIMYLLKTDGDTNKADSVPVFFRVPYMERPFSENEDDEDASENQKFSKSHLPFSYAPKKYYAKEGEDCHCSP